MEVCLKVIRFLLLLIISLFVSCQTRDLLFSKYEIPSKAKVTIENASSSEIKELKISLCGAQKVLANLKEGNSTFVEFEIRGDCHFSIVVAFQNRDLTLEYGYLTPGFNDSFKFRVENEKIVVVEAVSTIIPNYQENSIILNILRIGYFFLMFFLFKIILNRQKYLKLFNK